MRASRGSLKSCLCSETFLAGSSVVLRAEAGEGVSQTVNSDRIGQPGLFASGMETARYTKVTVRVRTNLRFSFTVQDKRGNFP
jgi:hypothetical protein